MCVLLFFLFSVLFSEGVRIHFSLRAVPQGCGKTGKIRQRDTGRKREMHGHTHTHLKGGVGSVGDQERDCKGGEC